MIGQIAYNKTKNKYLKWTIIFAWECLCVGISMWWFFGGLLK